MNDKKENDNYTSLSKEQLIELLQAFKDLMGTDKGKQIITRGNKVESSTPKILSNLPSTQEVIIKRRLTLPYYRERFALEIKEAIDAMLEDGKNRVYKFSDFKHISKTSLYLRIHQSYLYLTDNL